MYPNSSRTSTEAQQYNKIFQGGIVGRCGISIVLSTTKFYKSMAVFIALQTKAVCGCRTMVS